MLIAESVTRSSEYVMLQILFTHTPPRPAAIQDWAYDYQLPLGSVQFYLVILQTHVHRACTQQHARRACDRCQKMRIQAGRDMLACTSAWAAATAHSIDPPPGGAPKTLLSSVVQLQLSPCRRLAMLAE